VSPRDPICRSLDPTSASPGRRGGFSARRGAVWACRHTRPRTSGDTGAETRSEEPPLLAVLRRRTLTVDSALLCWYSWAARDYPICRNRGCVHQWSAARTVCVGV